MTALAEQIYEETKTLGELEAREVLDFIGYLKHKGGAAPEPPPLTADGADADWAEFERLAGTWTGKFDREACYDRPVLC